jgi:hypothetical protein
MGASSRCRKKDEIVDIDREGDLGEPGERGNVTLDSNSSPAAARYMEPSSGQFCADVPLSRHILRTVACQSAV